jgi:hypothetical protein
MTAYEKTQRRFSGPRQLQVLMAAAGGDYLPRKTPSHLQFWRAAASLWKQPLQSDLSKGKQWVDYSEKGISCQYIWKL